MNRVFVCCFEDNHPHCPKFISLSAWETPTMWCKHCYRWSMPSLTWAEEITSMESGLSGVWHALAQHCTPTADNNGQVTDPKQLWWNRAFVNEVLCLASVFILFHHSVCPDDIVWDRRSTSPAASHDCKANSLSYIDSLSPIAPPLHMNFRFSVLLFYIQFCQNNSLTAVWSQDLSP